MTHMIVETANAEYVATEAFIEVITPPPPVDYLSWAKENIVFSQRESSFPGPYNPDLFPYFSEVLTALSPEDPCRIVTLMGGAQIGKRSVGSKEREEEGERQDDQRRQRIGRGLAGQWREEAEAECGKRLAENAAEAERKRALHALSERADWLMRSIGDLDPTDEEQLELIRSARKAMQHLENMLARLEAT